MTFPSAFTNGLGKVFRTAPYTPVLRNVGGQMMDTLRQKYAEQQKSPGSRKDKLVHALGESGIKRHVRFGTSTGRQVPEELAPRLTSCDFDQFLQSDELLCFEYRRRWYVVLDGNLEYVLAVPAESFVTVTKKIAGFA